MRIVVVISLGLALLGTVPARAEECPGNPDAIGTSRVLVIDPAEHPRLGAMQYQETLPLADHEVVLTFDDGPLPPATNRVLETLASECVKASFFLVGQMARSFPETARKVYEAGHTIGTHSETHPLRLNKVPIEKFDTEVDDGIASVKSVLGDPKALAPFFRIPGFARTDEIDDELFARSLVTFSADVVADDWFHHIKPSEVVRRAMSRLEARGKGILLLHDIHASTADALPELLKQLKEKGFHIVHVVPMSADRPKTATAAEDWLRNAGRVPWPRVVAHVTPHSTVLPAPSEKIFSIGHPFGPKATIKISAGAEPAAATRLDPQWPKSAATAPTAAAPELPAPSPQDIGVPMDGREVVGEPVGLRPSVDVLGTTPAAKPGLKNTRAEIVPGGWPRTVLSER
jgi:peptidoglycan/xylan/chitin deacetylase (PgdA/CDA1 family)